MIPHRIRVSQSSKGSLRYLKSKTGLTPNILSRFAFVLSIRNLKRVGKSVADLDGQEFNAPTLFGEHQRLYELLLAKYVQATGDDRDVNLIIASHIENGLDGMRHLKSAQDVASLS